MATLLQPSVIIQWGEVNLGRLFYGVSMNFRSKNQGHDLQFSFEPSLRGYDLYRRCASEENRERPIVVTMGYSNGSSITGEFQYTGVEVESGNSQSVTVRAHSYAIGKLNRFRLNKTYGDGTSTLDLGELLRKESRYRGVVLDTEELEQSSIVHTSISGETTAEFMKKELYALGYELTLPLSPGVSGKDVLVDKPWIPGQVELAETDRPPGQRRAYFLAPELITDFTKNILYNPPNLDDDKLGSGASVSNSESQISESDVEETSPSSAQTSTAENEPRITSANREQNTASVSSLDSSGSAVSLRGDNKKETTRQAQANVFMVPRICGVRPRDFVLVPSIKGDYLEDWEVKSVTYSLEGVGITIDLQMERWQKDTPMVTNYDNLLNKAREYSSNWLGYYWNI